MKSILSKFKREDLPNESLRLLSDVIGINSVKALMIRLPGVTIHIPKSFYRQSDLNFIRKNKTTPIKEIAQELGCSERTVYRKLKLV